MTTTEQLMSRLNGYRACYFLQWATGMMVKDHKSFQAMSVAELVQQYDKGKCEFWETRNIIPIQSKP